MRQFKELTIQSTHYVKYSLFKDQVYMYICIYVYMYNILEISPASRDVISSVSRVGVLGYYGKLKKTFIFYRCVQKIDLS